MMTYAEADKKLGKRLSVGTGKRATKLVRNSGVEGDAIHLKYWATYVVTWYADGRIRLNSGGWRTVTTKRRINEYAPHGWGVSQKDYTWYLSRYLGGGVHLPYGEFEDGIILNEAEVVTHDKVHVLR